MRFSFVHSQNRKILFGFTYNKYMYRLFIAMETAHLPSLRFARLILLSGDFFQFRFDLLENLSFPHKVKTTVVHSV